MRLLRRNGSYAWEAAIDRGSGLASSTETSFAPKRSRLYRLLGGEYEEVAVQRLANHLFADYASWLARFSVTFGLFKAVPVAGGGFEFQTRLLSLNLLTFGKPCATKLNLETKNQEGKIIRSSQCTITIPIIGGAMTLIPVEEKRSWKSQNAGALKCTLTARHAPASLSSKDGQKKEQQTSCSMVTRLVDFRPRLAGGPPVNPFRAGMYLSTQSLVHAYVMWRLHRRCWNIEFEQTS